MVPMTPLDEAWKASGTTAKPAFAFVPPAQTFAQEKTHPVPQAAKAALETVGQRIPFVDYAADLSDLGNYCGTFKSACAKSPTASRLERRVEHFSGGTTIATGSQFDGLYEDELNDLFVSVGRPQVEASFPRASVTAATAPSGAEEEAPPAPAPVAQPVERRTPSPSVPGVQWFKRVLNTPENGELLNLALFALAGLLLILVLDQMVRMGIEISRSRIGMAVALRAASL